MTRLAPHESEIVRRLDQPAAEVPLPHPVDDAPPRQNVAIVDEKSGECRASGPLVVTADEQIGGEIGEAGKRRRPHFFQGLGHLATIEDADRPRRRRRLERPLRREVIGDGIDLPRRRERGKVAHDFSPEEVEEQRLCFRGRALGGGLGNERGKSLRNWIAIGGCEFRAAGRQSQPPHLMACGPLEVEPDREDRIPFVGQRRGEMEDRFVALAVARMDAPVGGGLAVEGAFHRIVAVGVIGGGAGDRHRRGRLVGGGKRTGGEGKLRQMKVARRLVAARSAAGE